MPEVNREIEEMLKNSVEQFTILRFKLANLCHVCIK